MNTEKMMNTASEATLHTITTALSTEALSTPRMTK